MDDPQIIDAIGLNTKMVEFDLGIPPMTEESSMFGMYGSICDIQKVAGFIWIQIYSVCPLKILKRIVP